MRIAILTTETSHHAYFVRELSTLPMAFRVFRETDILRAPFETAHPFERQRDDYEADQWFGGRTATLADHADVLSFGRLNEDLAVRALSDFAPDLAVVFGTGKLQANVIQAIPERFVNLHGGDPEEYRGLDTHLWAIYHGDFNGLVVTLHELAPELDSGDIVAQARLPIARGMGLYQLRRRNAEACVRLVNNLISSIDRTGGYERTPQKRKGRYYSFIPRDLKEICVHKFRRHCERMDR